jgi:hypothetical protein
MLRLPSSSIALVCFGLLGNAAACSFPVDEFVTQRALREDAGSDTSVRDSGSDDTTTIDTAVDDTAAPPDTSIATDTATADDTLAPADTLPKSDTLPDASDARDTAPACVCVDCPGDSRRCKAFDPPGCGVMNDPC